MLEQFASLLALTTIVLTAYGLGRPILRRLLGVEEDRLTIGVWSIAVGLIVAGLALGMLGLAGALYTPLISVLTLTGCFWAVGEIARECIDKNEAEVSFEHPRPGSLDDTQSPPWAPPGRWMFRGLLLLAGVAALGSLVGAMAPPTAGDALCHHLEIPKTFLAEHAIRNLPVDDRSASPLLVEIWYLWALALDGGVTAQMVHWGLGILLVLAAVVMATPIVGRPWAWIVGAVVVLVPGVNYQMTVPLDDLALALMATLALAAWWRAALGGESRGWLLLAGLAAGGALATKTAFWLFASAVAVTWGWSLLRRTGQRRELLEGATIVCLTAIGVGGPWHLLAGLAGSPLACQPNQAIDRGAATAQETPTLPPSTSLLGLASGPWQVTMHPDQFGPRKYQLGVLLLAAVPGLLFARRLRGLGPLLAVTLVYTILWYLTANDLRLLLPVVPLLCVAVVWVWIEMRRCPAVPRVLAGTVQAVVLVICALVPAVRSHGGWAVSVGLESREDYLLRSEPTFPAAFVVNHLSRADAHLLTQDPRTFYFNCRTTREDLYRRRTHYNQYIASPAELIRRLRRAGFTHLLLAEDVGIPASASDLAVGTLVEANRPASGDTSLGELIHYRFHGTDGATRHYRLIRLR